MNRTRMLVLSSAALALSCVLTFFVYRVFKDRLQPPDQTTRAVVAAQRLSLGTRITADSLRIAAVPRAMLPDGSFADVENVVGRGVIVSMVPNEPILESKLAPKEGGAGLTSTIPDGMRAVGVKVNDVIGVAGFVLPGTRVDLILTGSPKPDEDTTSKVILENVQVLAADHNVEQDANGEPKNVQVVTLLVTPEEAQKVALASVEGRIQLALRNQLDLEHRNPAAVQKIALYRGSTVAPLLPEKPKPLPRKKLEQKPIEAAIAPVAPPEPRMIAVDLYLGRNHETATFKEKEEKEP